MNRDREIIRKLVDVCLGLELDIQVAYAVLSAIRQIHPEIQIQEALFETHQQSKLALSVRERYQSILDKLDTEDATALLDMLPKSRYQN